MSSRARKFDECKCMSFFIEDVKLLKILNKIRDKFSNSIKKEFDSKHADNEKYLKSKIKFL